MKERMDANNPGLEVGAEISGYHIYQIIKLNQINSIYYDLEHVATGARHVHISNNDTENTFSVAFKTVPVDSTGVAHILEHTVLCGSERYAVRDPFFSMLKRSLSTFMNAFTASDWTMYPFTTQNRKDFYNLMDVYLDAAFFPRLEELNFKQEGHRLDTEEEPETEGDFRLQYKGVVYNEMKGAMSSPSEVMARSLLKSLYPETTYRFNSGGDPAIIPDLTYDQLKAFHKRHYHPSNAYFYTYGNFPLTEHLSTIDEKILKHFKKIDPMTEVPTQPRWSASLTMTERYPLGKNEDPTKKFQVCLAWLAADIQDTFEVLILTLLEQILLGNAASPLRKALIESNLGSSLSDGTGLEAGNRDTLFAVGLKDVKKTDADSVENIILQTLRRLVEDGVDNKLIESAIHQLEFHRKEVTNHPYPYGIKLLLSFFGSWLHGGNPVRILEFDADLSRLKDMLTKEQLFEDRIKRYLIENSHRIRLTLEPDQQMEAEENRRVAEMLEQIKLKMDRTELERIRKDAKALARLQDTPEDLSVLPTLEREDIPPRVNCIEGTHIGVESPFVLYQQPTSGIFYFSAAIGVGDLQQELVPLVPLFCHCFNKIGTAQNDYTEMARKIDAYTGGISLSAQARTQFDITGSCLPFVSFNGKCLERNQEEMFEIIAELLHAFDFSNLDRLKNLLLEYRAGLESLVVRNGHRLAMSLASRSFSTTMALDENWNGIHQLKMIKNLTDRMDADVLKLLSDDLTTIGRHIIRCDNIKAALIGEEAALSSAGSQAQALQQNLPRGSTAKFQAPNITLAGDVPREGWSTASAVSFVAESFPTIRLDHEDAAAMAVIAKIMRSLYLHREIREKGGAYGGFAVYDPENGMFCFASYRDPQIARTLDVFRRAGDFIRSNKYQAEDVKEAILQVCSEIDKPDPPGPAARKAFYRDIISLSDDERLRFKSLLLSLSLSDVRQAAEKYFAPDRSVHGVAVISSEESLVAANRALGEQALNIQGI